MTIMTTTLNKILGEQLDKCSTTDEKLKKLVEYIANLHILCDKIIDVLPDETREKLALNLGFKKGF